MRIFTSNLSKLEPYYSILFLRNLAAILFCLFTYFASVERCHHYPFIFREEAQSFEWVIYFAFIIMSIISNFKKMRFFDKNWYCLESTLFLALFLKFPLVSIVGHQIFSKITFCLAFIIWIADFGFIIKNQKLLEEKIVVNYHIIFLISLSYFWIELLKPSSSENFWFNLSIFMLPYLGFLVRKFYLSKAFPEKVTYFFYGIEAPLFLFYCFFLQTKINLFFFAKTEINLFVLTSILIVMTGYLAELIWCYPPDNYRGIDLRNHRLVAALQLLPVNLMIVLIFYGINYLIFHNSIISWMINFFIQSSFVW